MDPRVQPSRGYRVLRSSQRVFHLAVLVNRFEETPAQSAPFIRKAMWSLVAGLLEGNSQQSGDRGALRHRAEADAEFSALLGPDFWKQLDLVASLAERFDEEEPEVSFEERDAYERVMAGLPGVYRRVRWHFVRQWLGSLPVRRWLKRGAWAAGIIVIGVVIGAVITNRPPPVAGNPTAGDQTGQAPSPPSWQVPTGGSHDLSVPGSLAVAAGRGDEGLVVIATLKGDPGRYRVRVSASGTSCPNKEPQAPPNESPYPLMNLTVDELAAKQWEVTTETPADYVGDVFTLGKEPVVVGVSFSSDYCSNVCDRNLHVESLSVERADQNSDHE